MINLGQNRFLITDASELPDYTGCKNLIMDFETKSGCPETPAFDWHKGHQIAGVGVSGDNDPNTYYFGMRHKFGTNISVQAGERWLSQHLNSCENWVNHNVVFDALFVKKAGIDFSCRLVDTQTLCKVHDSDRWSHNLKALASDWLGIKYEEQDRVKEWLKAAKTKDYGDLPTDLAGVYGCEDVVVTRKLLNHVTENRHEQVKGIWDTEIDLTSVLFDMTYEGLRIDPTQVKGELVRGLRHLIQIHEEIERLADREFTNSHPCVYDIFVNQFALPILMRKEPDPDDVDELGNPTFNKDALALYEVHPEVTSQPEKLRVVSLVQQYRKLQYMTSHFQSWLDKVDSDGYIHPGYNQVIRTGRMSTRNPNVQGMNKAQRKFILADPGRGFLSSDYSQIEFRLIIHYIHDEPSIQAYNDDPNTDFHKFIAEEIRIQRAAGKTLNFSIGYGAGKRKVTKQLVANPTIIEEISERVNCMVRDGDLDPEMRTKTFDEMAFRRAGEVYNSYHDRLPGIKITSNEAARRCRQRGYVFNAYGRQRHLPLKAAHKAFNSIVQSCAMDIIKERIVAISPRFNAKSREYDLRLKTNIHDEVTSDVPVEAMRDPEVQRWYVDHLENSREKFSIPITAGLGVSDENWREASDDKIEGVRDGHKFGRII
ncbi:MAG: hypothetical protein COA69_09655 [Robiginitomaculum sp.]|nr:MAG: hypothetical protein COA69_09655 [Robiginitomaculum sp.]